MFYPFSYFRFDPTMIILIPAVLLTIYAQSKVQSNFDKYLRIPTGKGYTGVQVARRLLDQHGLQNIPIELSRGKLSDHYNPTKGILRLSGEVYQGHSIAAVLFQIITLPVEFNASSRALELLDSNGFVAGNILAGQLEMDMEQGKTIDCRSWLDNSVKEP